MAEGERGRRGAALDPAPSVGGGMVTPDDEAQGRRHVAPVAAAAAGTADRAGSGRAHSAAQPTVRSAHSAHPSAHSAHSAAHPPAHLAAASSPAEVSHAFIQHPPLRFDVTGAAGVMYDEGSRQVVVSSFKKVFAWPVNTSPSQAPPSSPRVCVIPEGPVLAVKFSLDRQILGIQRSIKEVELVRTDGAVVGRQRCKAGTDRILGFLWTDSPACNLVFVTTSGLELYQVGTTEGGIKQMDVKRTPVAWYVFTHESRMVLLASGPNCTSLSPFQFAATGVVKVPKFDALLTRPAKGGPPPLLAPEDVHIATIHGRVYCCQLDSAARQLHLFRFFRDAVVPQVALPVYSRHVAVSVVDNTLLVHQLDSKVALLFDALSNSPHPIASPLPLTLRSPKALPHSVPNRNPNPNPTSNLALSQPSHSEATSSREAEPGPAGESADTAAEAAGISKLVTEPGAQLSEPGFDPSGAQARAKPEAGARAGPGQARSEPGAAGSSMEGGVEMYGEGWVFLTPDLILDHARGLLWKLHLDLEAIAASCQDTCGLLAFLQRRRGEFQKARELSISTLRSIVLDRCHLAQVGTAIDIITAAFVSSAKASAGGRLPAQYASEVPLGIPRGLLPLSGGIPAVLGSSPGLQAAALALGISEGATGGEQTRVPRGTAAAAVTVAAADGVPLGAGTRSHRAESTYSVTSSNENSEPPTSSVPGSESEPPSKPGSEPDLDDSEAPAGAPSRPLPVAGGATLADGTELAADGAELAAGSAEEAGEGDSTISTSGKQEEGDGGRISAAQLGVGGSGGRKQVQEASRASSPGSSSAAAGRTTGAAQAGHERPGGGPGVAYEDFGARRVAAWQLLSPAVSPEELVLEVVVPVEEEMGGEGAYLAGVCLEMLRSAAGAGLRAPASLQAMLVRLLAQEGRHHQLWQLVHAQVVEPSPAVARQLLELGQQQHPPLRDLGLVMLRKLGAHGEYAAELTAGGHPVAAFRYLRQHQVRHFNPCTLLDAAAETGGAQAMASMLRACSDWVPGFRSSAEHSLYASTLERQLASH